MKNRQPQDRPNTYHPMHNGYPTNSYPQGQPTNAFLNTNSLCGNSPQGYISNQPQSCDFLNTPHQETNPKPMLTPNADGSTAYDFVFTDGVYIDDIFPSQYVFVEKPHAADSYVFCPTIVTFTMQYRTLVGHPDNDPQWEYSHKYLFEVSWTNMIADATGAYSNEFQLSIANPSPINTIMTWENYNQESPQIHALLNCLKERTGDNWHYEQINELKQAIINAKPKAESSDPKDYTFDIVVITKGGNVTTQGNHYGQSNYSDYLNLKNSNIPCYINRVCGVLDGQDIPF